MKLTPTSNARYFAIAAGAIALLLGGMWIANQGGVVAKAPEKFFSGTWRQLFRSLPIIAALWAAAIGFGAAVRHWLAPRSRHWLVIQVGTGLGVLLMLDWLAALAGWLNPWTAWLICGMGAAVLAWHVVDPDKREAWHPDHWVSPPWTLLLGLPALGLLLVACTCPPGTLWSVEGFAYDVTSYHLQVPREWLALGQMRSLHHNVYSHLPMLSEAGYMQIGAMHGSMVDAVYTTQLFHASAALLAAVAIARLVGAFVGGAAGVLGGVALLAIPWTIVTGSLAYNEMFVLAFGAAALLVLFDEAGRKWRGAALAGALAGLATLSKLPAGGMIALPIGLIILLRLHGPPSTVEQTKAPGKESKPSRKGDNKPTPPIQSASPDDVGRPTWLSAAKLAGVAALAGVLVLAPYLIRNAAWTGNPVFPFATGVFGQGHWDDQLVERWHKGHASKGIGDGVRKLGYQWLFNSGYGAVGGAKLDRQKVHEAARFGTEGGLPVLWLMAFIGAGVVLAWRGGRRIAAALLVMLGVQLVFWVGFTHHQSRFLTSTLLPGCALLGLGIGRIGQQMRDQSPWITPVLAIAIMLVFTVTSYRVFFAQTLPGQVDRETGELIPLPPWIIVDSLADPRDPTVNQPGKLVGQDALNLLPADARIYVVAEARMLYVRRDATYHTAFDASLLGDLLRKHNGNATKVTQDLIDQGYTHVWIDWNEYQRINAPGSYGYDPAVTLTKLIELGQQWNHIRTIGGVPIQRMRVGDRAYPPLFALPIKRDGDKAKPGPPDTPPQPAPTPTEP